MARALFWDIDGVMNTVKCWGTSLNGSGDYSARLDPALVRRAAKLTEVIDAQCVLSSTWRMAVGFERTMNALEKAGWENARQRFVGSTPHGSGARGLEIGAWLHEHPDVTEFAILDDGADMCGHSRRLVQTNNQRGLTDACCRLACSMFGCDWVPR